MSLQGEGWVAEGLEKEGKSLRELVLIKKA